MQNCKIGIYLLKTGDMFKIGHSNVIFDRTDKLGKLWGVDLKESYFVECSTPHKIENGLHTLLHQTRITTGLPKQDGYTEWFHIDSLETALNVIKALGLNITKGISQKDIQKTGKVKKVIDYWQVAEECRSKNMESVDAIIEFLSTNMPVFIKRNNQAAAFKIKFKDEVHPPFMHSLIVKTKNLKIYGNFLYSEGWQYENEDIWRYETTVNCESKYLFNDYRWTDENGTHSEKNRIWDKDSPYYNSETSQQARLALDEPSSRLYNFLIELEARVNSKDGGSLSATYKKKLKEKLRKKFAPTTNSD